MIQKELGLRLLSGLLLAIIAAAVILLLPPVFLLSLMGVLLFISSYEYLKSLRKAGIRLFKPIIYGQALFLPFAFVFRGTEFMVLMLTAIGFVYLFGWLIESMIMQKSADYSKYYLLHLVWVTLPFICAVYIQLLVDGPYILVWLALIIASSDIWAYFGGKTFGKHPLAPSLSPKKTIEGSIFGYIGALVIGVPYSYYCLNFSIQSAVLLIILMAFLGQSGDLVESKFKRFCGIKDSGRIIPGHGGVLDRVDAFLLALPLFSLIIYFFYSEWHHSGTVLDSLF